MPLDFSDLVPDKKAKKPNAIVGFLNKHSHIPKKVLDFIPRIGETAVRAGAAATLGAVGYGTPEERLAFVKEPFKGGKTLAEHATEIQAHGELTLPPKLRPVARAFGPSTAVGAQLASAFGDPLNLALGKGALLRTPNVSIAEMVLGTSGKTAAKKASAGVKAAPRGQDVVLADGTKINSQGSVDEILRNAIDTQFGQIKNGVVQQGVYTGVKIADDTGRLVPEFAKSRISDIAQQLDGTYPDQGVAKRFLSLIDPNAASLDDLKRAATAAVSNPVTTAAIPAKASPFTLLRFRDAVAAQLQSAPEVGEAVRQVSMRGVRTVEEAEQRLLAAIPPDAPDAIRATIAQWAERARGEAPTVPTAPVQTPEALKGVAEVLGPPPPVRTLDREGFEASFKPKLPSPLEAKRQFRARSNRFEQDMKRYNLESSNEAPYGPEVPGTVPRPVAPKAPEFKNVLPPGKRPIALEPPGTQRFPTDELRSAAVDDPAPFRLQRETLDRNIEAVFGERAGPVKAYLSDPLKADVTAAAEMSSRLRESLDKVFRGLRIKRGSREDFLAADYIEGSVTLEEIGQLLTKQKAQAIETAAQAGRLVYRDLLARVNAVLKNYGYKPVNERQNYVTHTRQIGTFLDRMGSLLAGGRDTLPTEISAINVDTKPGRQFFAFGKKRKGGSTHEGLITALDKYLDPAIRQIHITPSVQRLRAFQKSLIKLLPEEDSTKFSNFNSYLGQLTNMLAGKQNIIDRPVEKVFGRRFLSLFDGLRRRTGANLVGGSVSAALTNYIPLTQSLATTSKPAAVRALFEALAVPFKDPRVIDGTKSAFLTRRFPKTAIAPTLGTRTKEAASWLFRVVDQFTSNTVVGGKYYEGVRKGLSQADAMKAADDYAARLIADRSFGQQPLLFNSKTLGALTQFQVEVNNQVSFLMKDVPRNLGLNKRQVASALTQVAIYSYLFNELYERTAGRRPAADPIHLIVNTVGKVQEGASVTDFVDPTNQNTPVGEFVGWLPFASIASGGRIPIGGSLPNLVAYLSGESTLTRELEKPLYTLVPPVGGNQARKTVKGLQAYNQGYSATPAGRYRFDIDEDPLNLIRSALFGEYATPQAREYFKSK